MLCWEEGGILAMAEAAFVLDFLILVMIFSRLLSRESVKAPAATLASDGFRHEMLDFCL